MRKIINVVKRNKAIGAGRRKKRNKNKLEEGEVGEKTIGDKRDNEHFLKVRKDDGRENKNDNAKDRRGGD